MVGTLVVFKIEEGVRAFNAWLKVAIPLNVNVPDEFPIVDVPVVFVNRFEVPVVEP